MSFASHSSVNSARPLLALFLSSFILVACNAGSDSGDNNVAGQVQNPDSSLPGDTNSDQTQDPEQPSLPVNGQMPPSDTELPGSDQPIDESPVDTPPSTNPDGTPTQVPADEPVQETEPSEFNSNLPLIDVSESESPISGVVGIKRELNDSSTVFLLDGPEQRAQLNIIANPNLTNGDMSNAIGGAFYSFEAAQDDSGVVVMLETDEDIRSVYECDVALGQCKVLWVKVMSDNSLSFTPQPGLHYAFIRRAL